MSSDEPETPQYVINEWLKQCTCCPECGQMRPCNGVMAGGMCDSACDCDDDDPDYMFNEIL